jgi:hypothetical protein
MAKRSSKPGWVVGSLLLCVFGSALAADNAVPAKAPGPRFVMQGDEVYDSRTDLTWQRCNVGQQWKDGAGCLGVIEQMSFDDAQRRASGKWRVPTKDELTSLLGQSGGGQALQGTADATVLTEMDLQDLWYWSSTQYGASFAWYVNFHGAGFNQRNNAYALRLVRSGH